MSATIDQKAYLQKYLGGTSKDKKKKKKKAIKGQGFKIIDDDIDLSKLRALEGDELDLFDEGEDAPQIAGIVDERPEEIKKLEQFKTTSKWKVINQDDGFNSRLQVEEIKQDIKEIEKENELIFGKMYSDSEDDKKDSDASPPRKTSNKNRESRNDDSSKREKDKHRSHRPEEKEQDASPPRKKSKNTKASKYDKTSLNRNRQSVSPPRKTSTSKRANDDDFSIKEKRHRSPDRKRDLDSGASPPRMPKYKNSKSNSDSPKRKRDKYTSSDRKREDDSDVSPPRKYKEKNTKKHDSDSDFSPPRKRDRHISQSPIIKRQTAASPLRRDDKGKKRERKTRWGDFDDKHVNSQKSDSDQSPPRKILDDSKDDTYRKSKRNSDSDLSPKRRNNTNEKSTEKYSRHKRSDLLDRQSNSDLSPPRKSRYDKISRKRSASPNYKSNKSLQKRSRNNSKSPKRDRNDKNKEMPSKLSKTLEGKMAGLQDAKQLREENEQFRRKENEVFKEMADEVSGRNAQVVSRKGKRETSEERQKHKEKAEKQKELNSKYQKWNRGLKQIEDQESRVKDYLHESSKPLARFKDDKDLEARLKDIERAGDPMLQYIRERKRDRGELPPEKPSYKGSFPPNRFNIRPGYRWDGVDRSNGYEKKYFEQQSKRKAQEEEAYKWSTEDL